MANRKIVFIVNPISGTKDKAKIMSDIKTAPWLANDSVEIYYTKCAGDGYESAKRYAALNYDIVVAVGGDGTVNEVARGLLFSKSALAIIPVGSGNGLARELKIPLKSLNAAKLFENGEISQIDACMLNEHPFFCTAGFGFDATVGMTFAKCGHRGFFWYVISALKAYIKMKNTKYKLTIDYKTIDVEAFDITFANASQFGNDACIAPLADLRDGIIDTVVIRPFPWYKAAGVGLRLFRRNMDKSRYVTIYKCKSAVIERPHDDCTHYDGEPFIGGTRFEIGIKHVALNVLTPKNTM